MISDVMKRFLSIAVITVAFMTTSYAQVSEHSIRKIVRDYMVANLSNGEIYKEDDAPNSMNFMLYDISSCTFIRDYDMQMPISDTLSSYSFHEASAHAPINLMFVKDGKYVIVNMNKSLCDIDMEFKKLCGILHLEKKDVLYVLDKILSRYNANYRETLNSSYHLR